ncbi:Translation machinery-associated protein 22 [Chytridiales sp. JEL 0842]|nr:Translation machinery-associated protein 22 [Chytridiales sp. JEL 0842]
MRSVCFAPLEVTFDILVPNLWRSNTPKPKNKYCEFGSSTKRCKAWISANHPDLVSKYYPDAAGEEMEKKMEGLEVSDGGKEEKPKAESTKLDPAEKQELKKEKKRKETRIVIRRVERTKRKRVVIITGLEVFDIELKKAAKLIATKFACGASVTKNASGDDEIVVQGDVQDEVKDLILQSFKQVPKNQIDLVDK